MAVALVQTRVHCAAVYCLNASRVLGFNMLKLDLPKRLQAALERRFRINQLQHVEYFTPHPTSTHHALSDTCGTAQALHVAHHQARLRPAPDREKRRRMDHMPLVHRVRPARQRLDHNTARGDDTHTCT